MPNYQDTDMNDLTSDMQEYNPYGSANQMNEMVEHFANSSLNGHGQTASQPTPPEQDSDTEITRQEFPPGATLDEQILILAGWRFPVNGSTAITADTDVPASNRLLDDHFGSASSSTPPPLDRPPPFDLIGDRDWHAWMQNYSDQPPSFMLTGARDWYSWMLTYSFDDLSTMQLPTEPTEKRNLCTFMADEVQKRYEEQEINPLYAPKSHECYPYWVRDHPFNTVLMTIWLEWEEKKETVAYGSNELDEWDLDG